MSDIFSFGNNISDDREVTIWVSYMEIYNEQVNDLLDQNNTNLKIKEDPTEGYYIAGLKSVKVFSIEDANKLLVLGEKCRHYRQTDIHEKSSRSHTIFRILIENRAKDQKRLFIDNDANDEINIEEFERKMHLSYGTKYS